MAECHYRMGEYGEALEMYRHLASGVGESLPGRLEGGQIIVIAPTGMKELKSRAMLWHGYLSFLEGEYGKTVSIYREVIEKFAKDREAVRSQSMLAVVAYMKEDYQEAVREALGTLRSLRGRTLRRWIFLILG